MTEAKIRRLHQIPSQQQPDLMPALLRRGLLFFQIPAVASYDISSFSQFRVPHPQFPDKRFVFWHASVSLMLEGALGAQ
jgi:hypothetical protein